MLYRLFLSIFALLLSIALIRAEGPEGLNPPEAPTVSEAKEITEKPTADQKAPKFSTDAKKTVYIIPIQDQIASPVLYILRRGLKEAIENNVDGVVLDMNTPGGRLDITLEMIEMLDRFEGDTVTYVNSEAISAGAYISAATQEIYFAPKGIIGAAAVIAGAGQEIDKTMKQKIDSYLRAKIRLLSKNYPHRAAVIRAMMDADYVLEIDGHILKNKGELLTLTANEAIKTYGDPPQPLLGSGIFESVEALLDGKYGRGNYTISDFKVTWSEKLAQWFNPIAPMVFGLGILCLFIEFKTPGFGLPGIAGIALILLFFIGQNIAGLAGHEEILVFVLGLGCLAVELFLLPGTVFFGLLGIVMILGSILWAMADFWPSPGDGPSIDFSAEALIEPFIDLALGLGIAIGGFILLWHFLPRTSLANKLILKRTIATPDPNIEEGNPAIASLPKADAKGLAVTDLHPTGEVEIDGHRYQAEVMTGVISRGTPIVVVGHKHFQIVVRSAES